MSTPVRLADYLYEQVARLAAAEKRSTANMVQVLLEQALKMNGQPVQPAGTELSERGASDGVAQTERPRRREVPGSSPGRVDPPRSESSGCRIDTPKGIKCKVCGKVH